MQQSQVDGPTPTAPDAAAASPSAGPDGAASPSARPDAAASPSARPDAAASPSARPDAEGVLRVGEPPRTARIIALANQKGGVGKTTTTINLAAGFAELGRHTLIVDFDPQGGCGIGLGIEPSSLELSVYNALLDRSCDVSDVIHKTTFENLELIPSNIDLAAAELMLVQEVAREQTLLRALAPLRVKYDFILIDCPPSLGLLTINALTAADSVIIPLECEYYALRGMAQLMDSIEKIRERLNPRLQVDGIVATMFDSRTVHAKEVLARVQEAFGRRVFETVIRKTIRFAEAPVVGEPILSYAPGSPGASSYRKLAREVMDRVASSQPAGR